MRKYDYTLMERALNGMEESEARESLRLLELNWTPKQILQFFRERDKWRSVRVLEVQPTVVLKNTDEPVKIEVLMDETTDGAVQDQITDAVTTPPKPEIKNDLFRTRKKKEEEATT